VRAGFKRNFIYLAFLPFCALPFFLSCGQYSLGPLAAPPFRTLFVEAVVNDSLAPQAAPLCSASLREAFLGDGRVKLTNSSEAADAVLSLRLTNYRRRVASYRSDDTARANAFEITLEGEVSLSDNRRDGKTLFAKRSVKGVAFLGWDDPKASPEGRQPLAAAIRSLSIETVSMALDAW